MFSVASLSDSIEFSPSFSPRSQISHVVFDFDGTLSWLRHGWPEIMCGLFRERFPCRPNDAGEKIHEFLLADILSLNGKPAIQQMMRFAERISERGGEPPEPEKLLREYQRRLDEVIRRRSEKILRGEAQRDEFIVHGARAFLENLHRRGLTLIILSGTVEPRVKQEADLLGLARYFGEHIYGSTPDHARFSKRMVIDRLLREERITGDNLLSFGDGPAEIEGTKQIGGLAIAVASDEEQNGSGIADPLKRKLLLSVGADAVIPDYRDADALIELIFNR